MYVSFDGNVLHVRPENYSDEFQIKHLVKVLLARGAKIEETRATEEYEQREHFHNPHERTFGYADARQPEPIYDSPPFSPHMEYDNTTNNVRGIRFYPGEYGARSERGRDERGERGGDSGGDGRGGSGGGGQGNRRG